MRWVKHTLVPYRMETDWWFRQSGCTPERIERLKQHLMLLGQWTESDHSALTQQLEAQVEAAWSEAISHSTTPLDSNLMFDDVFKDIPEHLRRQREALAAERA